MQEAGTIGILQKFLRENTKSLSIVDRNGWFYAVKRGTADGSEIGSAHSPIAFRADMDALPMEESISLPHVSCHPGTAHKCGHDGHMAALCGLALELDRMETERTVYLIFQPAEETGQGALLCRELLKEKGIGEIYAFHNLGGFPENSIVFRRGLTQPTSEGLTIRMHGQPSHASAPEKGRNPSAAIAELALYAQHLPAEAEEKSVAERGMALCTVVGMKCGEGDFGISAGEGSLSVTLRAEKEQVMRQMERKLLMLADRLAARDGLETEHEIRDAFPETRNDDAALERVIRQAESLLLPVIEMKEIWRASEDFGHYLKICPGAMFYIGNGEDYPALHTGAYDFNDRILGTAVDMFLELV